MFRLIALFALATLTAQAFQLPDSTTQCVVGIANDWNDSHVTLTLYEKSGNTWHAATASWQGRLGKNGLVWGLGMHPVPNDATVKSEGDRRAPACVFHIGDAWGYACSIHKLPSLTYHQVTPRDLWIEDPASADYNHHVRLDHAPSTAWEKKQQMKQTDPVHSLKLFIAHNAPPASRAGCGSSIFFHIWRENGAKPTAGCTTMPEDKLKSLVSRIDPARHPVYILLPRAEYDKLRKPWALP
jgi:L,D-peptidoglycan transpeptidase YkuD (ErfK/YbiS/YcfS/YnhG family)